ncbi:hypothetical protein BDW59DRAFT_9544 [Aspergillus cavernicola]|uniref:DUF7770 domain-containing protein n=1 Tax=Aspergillus cavernicola TaxID=176166 RepID=A0ABR4HPE3_9EURO
MNLQRPNFQPLIFIPAGQQNEILHLPVWSLHAVCHERLPQGGNHWSLYLGVGEPRSVHLDITPSYTIPDVSIPGGSKAYMVLSLLEEGIPAFAQKSVRLDVPHGKIVQDFVNLLIDHGRQKYEFNAEGAGLLVLD